MKTIALIFSILFYAQISHAQIVYGNAVQLQGRTLSPTAPNDGQIVGWNSTFAAWLPVDLPPSDGNATSLQGVAIATTTPTSGQVLTYNSTLSEWNPQAGGGASGSAGAIQFSGGSGAFSSDATKLFWDNTAKVLEINGPAATHGLISMVTGSGTEFNFISMRAGPDASDGFGFDIMLENQSTGDFHINRLSAGSSSETLHIARASGEVSMPAYTNGVAVFSVAGLISSVTPSTSGNVLTSNGTTWVSSPAAGGGGDATSLQGVAISTTSPTSASVLAYNSTGKWYPGHSLGLGQESGGGLLTPSGIGATVFGSSLGVDMVASGIGAEVAGQTAGNGMTASGIGSSARGKTDFAGDIGASGIGAMAIGHPTAASVTASGVGALARGEVAGGFTHILASGVGSHAAGQAANNSFTASGDGSHAMGWASTGSGGITASGKASFAQGFALNVSGDFAGAFGEGQTVSSLDAFAVGRYANAVGVATTSWASTDPLFVVGNGTGPGSEANALTILKNGTFTVTTQLDSNAYVNIFTGQSTSNAASSTTGTIQMITGDYSGTGSNSSTGSITISTGNTPDNENNNSGALQLETGNSGWLSGEILIKTGEGTVADDGYSGNVSIYTGGVSGTAPSGDIVLSTGGTATGIRGTIKIGSHITVVGDSPSVSSCGTGSPSVAGTDIVGRITAGGGALSSCTLTFAQPWGTAPVCIVDDETAALLLAPAPTTTTLVITGTSITSHSLSYHCIGY